MTNIALTKQQEAVALVVAREIGDAIAAAREALGHTKKSLAKEAGMHETTVRILERGTESNLKLGNAMKLLDYLGLTLVVVPRDSGARDQRIGALLDRMFALRGGEDLLRNYLKRRGYELARGDHA